MDSPETAKFLTPEERAFVAHKQSGYLDPLSAIAQQQKEVEYTCVGEDERFELRYIWSTVTDWQA